MHRDKLRIIFDLLKSIEDRETPLPIAKMFEICGVKGLNRQMEYHEILEDFGLITSTQNVAVISAVITHKGRAYIASYQTIMILLGELKL